MTLNIDPAEVTKFDKLAATWWEPQGAAKPLHDINPLRLDFIMQHCSLSTRNILDVGCGGGILAESLALQGGTVTGIDMSAEALEAAAMHAQQSQLKIQYQQSTAEAFAEQYPQQFDVITCMELLEHVPDPAAIITACAKLIKPDGHLFFSTLNRSLKAYAFAVIGAEYVLQLLPKGTHDYAKFIKPSELEAWMRHNQLQLKSLRGMTYNPFTKAYTLTDDVSVNYLAYCQPHV